MILSIASWKGGTGKTTVGTNLALSLGKVQIIDCDVEGNMKKIEQYCKSKDLSIVGKLPYDSIVTEAMIHEKNFD
ncbi:MAG: AAA family ATPase [Candidatus Methylarchaceae archaeon HK02M1]|nr:AAA family ATPase [Candidatus Methylarchaceae archaeon HK02M1]